MSSRRVLVTGGAGFIGSHLVDALIGQGDDVRVLDVLEEQVHGDSPGHRNPGAEYVLDSVTDRDAVDDALHDIDAVVHLAAQVGVGQSMYDIHRYVDQNCTGTGVLLEGMVSSPRRPAALVVASSMSIYGEGRYACSACAGEETEVVRTAGALSGQQWEPTCVVCGAEVHSRPTPESKRLECASVYAVTKRDQEELCLAVGRAYGIRTLSLRLFNTYGPRQSLANPYTGVIAIFASRLLAGRTSAIFEDGLQCRDFVHVSDVVRAIILALENEAADGLALNVGTGKPTTVAEVARLLASNATGEVHKSLAERPGRYREGDVRHCYADISLARRVLGYEPKVHIQEGIAELFDWIRNHVPVVHDKVDLATAELTSRGLLR